MLFDLPRLKENGSRWLIFDFRNCGFGREPARQVTYFEVGGRQHPSIFSSHWREFLAKRVFPGLKRLSKVPLDEPLISHAAFAERG